MVVPYKWFQVTYTLILRSDQTDLPESYSFDINLAYKLS